MPTPFLLCKKGGSSSAVHISYQLLFCYAKKEGPKEKKSLVSQAQNQKIYCLLLLKKVQSGGVSNHFPSLFA